MMSERQEEVTTADLAGQPPRDPRDTNRSDLIEEADLERPDDLTPDDLTPDDLTPEDLGPGDPAPNGDLARENPAPDGTVAPEDLAPEDLAHDDPAHDEVAHDEVHHDDVAHDDLAPRDLAPKDPAFDEVASDPALNRTSQLAPEEPDRDRLEQEHEDPKVAAAGAGPAVTPVGVPEAPARPEVATADSTAAAGPLLASDDAEAFRARWTDVQFGFVNSPRQAVEQGDGLVAEVMQHLARTFAEERSRLESQWDQGSDVSTEDLRTAFQRYRSFFERLLAT
jgi:hypothetical protein